MLDDNVERRETTGKSPAREGYAQFDEKVLETQNKKGVSVPLYKKLIKKFLSPIIGKTYLQPFFEKVHLVSLLGMNIGLGGDVKSSGEIRVLQYVNKKLKELKIEKIVIFDVGANIGLWTNECRKVFNENAEIHLFEPLPHVYDELRKVNQRNHTYNFGFSDIAGRMVLNYNPDALGLSSLYKRRREHIEVKLNYEVEVKLQTIDNFCKEKNIDKIHLLKLDTEGHELKVLWGAKQMLSQKKIFFIQFEFGGCNVDSRTFFQDFFYLLKDNYKLYRVMRNGLYEIKKYSERYEIFVLTNFLAELKAIGDYR